MYYYEVFKNIFTNREEGLIIGVLLISLGFYSATRAQNIEVNPTLDPKIESPIESCFLLDKLKEKDNILASMSLGIRPKEIKFTENRIAKDKNGNPTLSKKTIKDKEVDIGFELLNTLNCQTSVIKVTTKITPEGVSISAPAGYQINIIERSNGIRWNLWNTLYEVKSPANMVVIKNSFPIEEINYINKRIKNKKGKLVTVQVEVKTVKNFLYSPYGGYAHKPEIINAGRSYVKSLVSQARDELAKRKVISKTFPGVLVSDLQYLPNSYFERLPFLEQGDLTEFIEDSQKNVERTLVILGANQEFAFSRTGSKAGALGWVQYTAKTWKAIRKQYPNAGLPADFEAGASDHKYSMMAAMLLHDYNLRDLVKKFGKNVLKDPDKLEEYLASAYNGSPARVKNSLSASILSNIKDWAESLSSKKGGLANETKGYLVKLRFLQQNNLP